MKLYVIMLQGQGDTDIKLVRQDGWDALHTGIFTPEMLADYKAQYRPDEDDFSHLESLKEMRGGSATNDVALSLPAVQIDGQPALFRELNKYTQFLRNHPEIEIIDEYSGYIY